MGHEAVAVPVTSVAPHIGGALATRSKRSKCYKLLQGKTQDMARDVTRRRIEQQVMNIFCGGKSGAPTPRGKKFERLL
jgi:hypothetical protein